MNRGVPHLLLAWLVLGFGSVCFWLGHDQHSDPLAIAEGGLTADEEHSTPVATVNAQPLRAGTVAKLVDAYGTIQAMPGSSVTVSVPFDAVVQQILVTPGLKVANATPVLRMGPTAETELQLKQANDAIAAATRGLADVRRRLEEQLATNAEVIVAEQAEQAAQTQLASLQQRGLGEPKDISADANGVVGEIAVTVGQVVTAGTPLMTIASDQKFEATIGVEPAVAAEVKVGDSVALRDIHASADAALTSGTIRLIAPQINPQTRLRDVTLSLPPDAALPLGTFVIAQIETTTQTGLTVPRSAVIPDEDDSVLFVVKGGKAVRHVVTVALVGRDDLLITSDELHVGDEIVVNGNAELEDGMAVHVEAAATAPSSEAQ